MSCRCAKTTHQIIKHALAHYIKRDNADPKDLIIEKNLLEKYTQIVEYEKEKYGIKDKYKNNDKEEKK